MTATKNIDNIRTKISLLLWMLLVLLQFSCKKEITPSYPDGKADTRLNIYTASGVAPLLYADYPVVKGAPLHVYVGENTGAIPSSAFPDHPLLYASGTTWPRNGDKQTVNFTRYNAGTQTLFFADTANRVIHQNNFDLLPETFHTVYLTDGVAGADQAPVYQSLGVSEAREGEAGKTLVRFVHLSADAGEFAPVLLNPDGSTEVLATANLPYLQASSPQGFGVEKANENGLLSFELKGADNTRIVAGVPYKSGACYTVVIKGFRQQQVRKLGATTVTVPAGITTEVRRMY